MKLLRRWPFTISTSRRSLFTNPLLDAASSIPASGGPSSSLLSSTFSSPLSLESLSSSTCVLAHPTSALSHLHSRKNTNRNTLTTRSLLSLLGQIKTVLPTTLATSQAPSNQEYILSAITGRRLDILTVPVHPPFSRCTFVLCPTFGVDPRRPFCRTEQLVSPNGQFSLTSNASSSHDINHVQGAFYTGINPDQTVQDAVLSVAMQSSPPSVFNQSFVCFAVAENFTDLLLYVCLPSSHINHPIRCSHSSRFRTTSVQLTVSYTTSLSCFHRLRSLPGSTPFPRSYPCLISGLARLMAMCPLTKSLSKAQSLE